LSSENDLKLTPISFKLLIQRDLMAFFLAKPREDVTIAVMIPNIMSARINSTNVIPLFLGDFLDKCISC